MLCRSAKQLEIYWLKCVRVRVCVAGALIQRLGGTAGSPSHTRASASMDEGPRRMSDKGCDTSDVHTGKTAREGMRTLGGAREGRPLSRGLLGYIRDTTMQPELRRGGGWRGQRGERCRAAFGGKQCGCRGSTQGPTGRDLGGGGGWREVPEGPWGGAARGRVMGPLGESPGTAKAKEPHKLGAPTST